MNLRGCRVRAREEECSSDRVTKVSSGSERADVKMQQRSNVIAMWYNGLVVESWGLTVQEKYVPYSAGELRVSRSCLAF